MSDGLGWQKSSHSSGNPSSDCLEVAVGPGRHLRFRESEAPDVVLVTNRARLGALLRRLHRLPGEAPAPPR